MPFPYRGNGKPIPRISAFLCGFVLGAALMATPALAVALGALALLVLAVIHTPAPKDRGGP